MAETKVGLRDPFPAEQIGKLPRSTCRQCSESQRKRCDQHTWVSRCPECHGGHSSATMHLDYVGHADVTDRLLRVDPAWTWEPMALTGEGLPALDRAGNLWIRLTVGGVTRIGVGDGKNAKECIGDALRNAAMRFGVALDLWAKGDRHFGEEGQAADRDSNPDAETRSPKRVERHKGKPPGEDPWETDPLKAAKRDVWQAAVDLGVVAESTDKDRRKLAEDYAHHMGGDLASASVEELTAYLFLLRDRLETQSEAPA